MTLLRRPRGTRDLLSDTASRLLESIKLAQEIFETYGYRPIVTPVFERTELFVRGIGEASDIVEKEMYTFEDRRGRSLTLRPEGTAPVVRAYLENNLGRESVAKLYYAASMYRYERPQAGRYREFWQVGAEALGSAAPLLDAELILMADAYLRAAGLSRLNHLINSMGCRDCRPAFVKKLKQYAAPIEDRFCDDCRRRLATNPLRIFDCGKESCRALTKEAPKILEGVCPECRRHFDSVLGYLDTAGLKVEVEPGLVRGFDYYTRTTFETQTPLLGAQNAVGGGGRYDYLVEEYGGKPTPAIGFALGVDRILLAADAEGEGAPRGRKRRIVYLATKGEPARRFAVKVMTACRRAGIETHLSYEERSLKAQLRAADRLGARYSVIVGDEEAASGSVSLREMGSGEQRSVSIAEAVATAAGNSGEADD